MFYFTADGLGPECLVAFRIPFPRECGWICWDCADFPDFQLAVSSSRSPLLPKGKWTASCRKDEDDFLVIFFSHRKEKWWELNIKKNLYLEAGTMDWFELMSQDLAVGSIFRSLHWFLPEIFSMPLSSLSFSPNWPSFFYSFQEKAATWLHLQLFWKCL